MQRRTLILFGFISGLGAIGAALLYRFKPLRIPLSWSKRDFIAVYVDRLIPRDDISPGAIDLGVEKEVISTFSRSVYLRRLLSRVPRLLDVMAEELAGTGFVGASEAIQNECISRCESAEVRTLENQLFHMLRRHSMRHYYARAESWQGMGIDRPPQPAGYYDFAVAPIEHTST